MNGCGYGGDGWLVGHQRSGLAGVVVVVEWALCCMRGSDGAAGGTLRLRPRVELCRGCWLLIGKVDGSR